MLSHLTKVSTCCPTCQSPLHSVPPVKGHDVLSTCQSPLHSVPPDKGLHMLSHLPKIMTRCPTCQSSPHAVPHVRDAICCPTITGLVTYRTAVCSHAAGCRSRGWCVGSFGVWGPSLTRVAISAALHRATHSCHPPRSPGDCIRPV